MNDKRNYIGVEYDIYNTAQYYFSLGVLFQSQRFCLLQENMKKEFTWNRWNYKTQKYRKIGHDFQRERYQNDIASCTSQFSSRISFPYLCLPCINRSRSGCKITVDQTGFIGGDAGNYRGPL